MLCEKASNPQILGSEPSDFASLSITQYFAAWEGLEPSRLTASASKADVAAISPPCNLIFWHKKA